MKLSARIFNSLIGSFMVVGFICNIESLQAKPFVPESDSMVLEQVPLSGNPHMRQLRAARKALAQDPRNLELAVHVARQFVELGGAEADPRYDGYAQSALQPWWHHPHPPTAVLFIRALLRQRNHQFDQALEDLNHLLRLQPNHAQAWLTQSVIHQVQGHYDQARQSCLPLLHFTKVWVATTCIANVTSLNGRAQESYNGLLHILSQNPSLDPQEQLWILTILAETSARLGNPSSAEEHFQQALSLGLRDTYLLGAYSDWLLDQHRPADVLTLLINDLGPDALLLRASLAAKQLNSPQLSDYIATLRARFAATRLRKDGRHLREEARFTLHLLQQPHQALQLALENWQVQREPWDARIVLEAALAARNYQAAQPVIEWLHHVQLEDPQIQHLVEQLS